MAAERSGYAGKFRCFLARNVLVASAICVIFCGLARHCFATGRSQ